MSVASMVVSGGQPCGVELASWGGRRGAGGGWGGGWVEQQQNSQSLSSHIEFNSYLLEDVH